MSAGRQLGHQQALFRDPPDQFGVSARVGVVDAGGQYRDGGAVGGQRPSMSRAVDAVRGSGDDGPAAVGEAAPRVVARCAPYSVQARAPTTATERSAQSLRLARTAYPQTDGAAVIPGRRAGRAIRPRRGREPAAECGDGGDVRGGAGALARSLRPAILSRPAPLGGSASWSRTAPATGPPGPFRAASGRRFRRLVRGCG